MKLQELLAASVMLDTMLDNPVPIGKYRTLNKLPLTAKQKRARRRNKLQNQSRKVNRK